MKAVPGVPERSISIDRFRGSAALGMVAANFLAGVGSVPPWLKHAEDTGLTIIDLIAPAFIFALGLSLGISFYRRMERSGEAATYGHFVRRYLALIGIGAIISSGEELFGFSAGIYNWGVLQAIGAAGLATLPFLRFKTLYRLAAGAGLLGLYQVILDRCWIDSVLASSHGGLPGTLGWAAMLILSTVFADLFHAGLKSRFSILAGVFLLTGLLLHPFSPISKNRVSAAYVLVSLGICGFIFLIFYAGRRLFSDSAGPLVWWGSNPLLLYILHYLLLALFVFADDPSWYTDAAGGLTAAECAFLVGIMTLGAYLLYRRNLRFSL